jgi:hypothetical protein
MAAYAAGSGPIGLAASDLNGDGRPDLAAVSHGASTVSVLLGQATATATLTPAVAFGSGSHTGNAGYQGDANFGASTSSNFTLTAAQATPAIALTPSPGSSAVYGQSFKVGVAITGQPNPPVATGSITFSVDSGAPQSAALTNGAVMLTLSGLGVGGHSLTVNYAGDANYAAGSQSLSLSVSLAPLTVVVANANQV